ncbi:hypothetical protein [Kluyvera genomosp. 3]|uniref:Uncharacterized protein n=1 Tax=Kluyvera genomosp. 3 TaxID=2774055 RepID=A0A6G9RKP0_9ENTR|nr:hypothetical protein [Kluyvera genomosp. 3]QIR27536.1 hypothetical protein GY169_12310 [Kluyvera genomosp. 3]
MWGLVVACLASQPCTDEVINTYPTEIACEVDKPLYEGRNPECLEIAGFIRKGEYNDIPDPE